jgi:hypothetical protein
MAWRSFAWLAAAALVGACATTKPAAVAAPPAPLKAAPTALRLAWMPLEPRASPDVARVVNERFPRVVVEGVTETFQAPVSMEMAQLAIECIERTPKCYGAVGRSVGADRLLWAELVRVGRRDAGVTLRVSLFDVARGAVVKQEARTFPNAKAASESASALVDAAFGARAAAGGASP